MAKLVGTAGHVDHGKTSLIRALTGIDTDRLPEEKARGLTIDLGFAFLDLPGVGRVSIVDVPGHEKFVTNMLSGATAMDVVLLCVAADEGVQPQSQEHLAILELLPVETLIVVLTRGDAATDGQKEDARLELEMLLEGSRFEGSRTVLTSAKTGEGLEELRSVLTDCLRADGKGQAGAWFLPVDRVFTKVGHGTVVTGTLQGGIVKQGHDAVVWPQRLKAKVRAVQTHGEGQPEAEYGQRVSLNLGGIDREEVKRGDLVALPGVGTASDCFDALVHWVSAVKHGSRVRISMGSGEVIGRVFLNDFDEDLVQFRLEQEVGIVRGMPLVVRQYSPPNLLGGGSVEVPVADVRRKNSRVSRGGEGEGITGLFVGREDGLTTRQISRLVGVDERELTSEFERLKESGELLSFAGFWMTHEVEARCREHFLKALQTVHFQQPEKSLVVREEVVREAGFGWAGKVLDRLISYWTDAGVLRSRGTLVALAGFQPELKAKQRVLLDRVKEVLTKEFPNVPAGRLIADLVGVPPQAIDQILQVGMDAGELVRVDEGMVYVLEDLDRFMVEVRGKFSGRAFSASEFRDVFGTSRKYAIPLLEYFDARGLTVRVGDTRKVVG